MAGKRFIFFYKLQSLLNPSFSKITSAFFIFNFSPASFWIQQASATQVSNSLPEVTTADWELTNEQRAITFPRWRDQKNLGEVNEGEIAASGLVDEAKHLYESGHFLLSLQTWQQAAIAYRVLGDTPSVALALSNQALAYQQLGRLERAISTSVESLKLLKNLEKPENSPVIAQILNNHASLQLASGQAEQALTSWQKAEAAYQTAGDRTGVTWTKLNSTQALQALGFYRRAVSALDSVQQNLQSTPASPLKAVTLRSLGNALRGVGQMARSRQILEQSLGLAQKLGLHEEIDATLISLGNTARMQQDKTAAWKFYHKAASGSGFIAIQAKLNQLSLLIEYKAFEAAANLASQIAAEISSLPANRASIYAQINFAQSLKNLPQTDKIPSEIEIARLIANTIERAKSLEDPTAEAYALGCLGNLYEENQQWTDAKKLTQQSLMLAQSIRAPEINYRFSWQLGRILKAQGDINGAIASYTQSTNALKSLRGDLVAINPSVQFDFRDRVEPVYRQLADLLLLSKQPSGENLIQARNAIEALQVAQLNNFFQTACLDAKPIQIDQAIDADDPKAAVFYPIILPDRLEVIVKLPGLPLQNYKVNIAQSKLEKLLQELRKNLSLPYTLQEVHLLSKQVYDWLIKPAEKSLAQSSVNTLVFVLDGDLRNIPMAALYDGQEYLIQKYAIAISPGLQMLPPQPIERVRLKALSAGLAEARQGYAALPGVENELNQIKSAIPGVILFNQNFTSRALQNQLQEADFSIVHLATHGQFSSLAAKTYILAWDQPIFVKDLDLLLRSKDSQHSTVELLVLSACETAAGDNRAALGLAGIAIRAGARSTLATLWNVDDEASSALMSKFYHELTQAKLTKAQALRQAQLAVLQSQNYQHPKNWSGYVLLGNWL